MSAGRPSKYDNQSAITAGWLARDGKTDKEIAEALGISESTLNEWKKKYPEFSESLKKNKDIVDNQVEDSLLKRAVGYEYERTEIEAQMIGGKEVKKKKVIQMHVSPDPLSCFFWLKNRRPDKWRNDTRDINFDKAKGEINDLFESMRSMPSAKST